MTGVVFCIIAKYSYRNFFYSVAVRIFIGMI